MRQEPRSDAADVQSVYSRNSLHIQVKIIRPTITKKKKKKKKMVDHIHSQFHALTLNFNVNDYETIHIILIYRSLMAFPNKYRFYFLQSFL